MGVKIPSYFYENIQVRFGPIDRVAAYTRTSTYLMRNAQAKIWVSYTANGSIRVEINVRDFYDVKPGPDKDDRYNKIANVLDPIHQATGANTNMQTRSSWEKIVD